MIRLLLTPHQLSNHKQTTAHEPVVCPGKQIVLFPAQLHFYFEKKIKTPNSYSCSYSIVLTIAMWQRGVWGGYSTGVDSFVMDWGELELIAISINSWCHPDSIDYFLRKYIKKLIILPVN